MKTKTFSKKDKIIIYIEGKFTFTDYNFLEEMRNLFEKCNEDKSLIFFTKDDGMYKREIVLDFSKCTFLDTSAIGMLVIMNDEAERNFIYLTLKTGKGFCKSLFKRICFDEFYKIDI